MMGDVFPTVDEDLLKAFAEGPCQQTTMLFEHAAIGTCATGDLDATVDDVNNACCEQGGE
jgi:hypothetical protein